MSTKAEHDHLNAVADLGCIVCRNLGHGYSPAIIHHVRTVKGQRITRNHEFVLPLCPTHHSAGSKHGFHQGSKPWQKTYGTEEELLSQVQILLTEVA